MESLNLTTLQIGDIIQNASGNGYIVIAIHPAITAIRVLTVMNGTEWKKVEREKD